MAEKEYIEREALWKKFYNDPTYGFYGEFTDGSDAAFTSAEVKEIIAQAPAADVVEVVRCKDCKRWLKDAAGCTDLVGRCEWANYMVGANGYCVYGEAKMDGKGEG